MPNTDTSVRYHCSICNIWILDNPLSKKHHNEGKRHREAYQKMIDAASKRNKLETKHQSQMDNLIKSLGKNLPHKIHVQPTNILAQTQKQDRKVKPPPGMGNIEISEGTTGNLDDYDVDEFVQNVEVSKKGEEKAARTIGKWEIVSEIKENNNSSLTITNQENQDNEDFTETLSSLKSQARKKKYDGIMSIERIEKAQRKMEKNDFSIKNQVSETELDIAEISFKKKRKFTNK